MLVNDHGQRPWLDEAPQRGARHVPEGPVGAEEGNESPLVTGGLIPLPPAAWSVTGSRCLARRNRSPLPCASANDLVPHKCEGRAYPEFRSSKNLAGSAEPSRVARPKAVVLWGNHVIFGVPVGEDAYRSALLVSGHSTSGPIRCSERPTSVASPPRTTPSARLDEADSSSTIADVMRADNTAPPRKIGRSSPWP